MPKTDNEQKIAELSAAAATADEQGQPIVAAALREQITKLLKKRGPQITLKDGRSLKIGDPIFCIYRWNNWSRSSNEFTEYTIKRIAPDGARCDVSDGRAYRIYVPASTRETRFDTDMIGYATEEEVRAAIAHRLAARLQDAQVQVATLTALIAENDPEGIYAQVADA